MRCQWHDIITIFQWITSLMGSIYRAIFTLLFFINTSFPKQFIFFPQTLNKLILPFFICLSFPWTYLSLLIYLHSYYIQRSACFHLRRELKWPSNSLYPSNSSLINTLRSFYHNLLKSSHSSFTLAHSLHIFASQAPVSFFLRVCWYIPYPSIFSSMRLFTPI